MPMTVNTATTIQLWTTSPKTTKATATTTVITVAARKRSALEFDALFVMCPFRSFMQAMRDTVFVHPSSDGLHVHCRPVRLDRVTVD